MARRARARIDTHAAAPPRVAEAGAAFGVALGFKDLPPDYIVLPTLAESGRVLLSEDAGRGASFLLQGAQSRRRALSALIELQSKVAAIRGRLQNEYRDAVLKAHTGGKRRLDRDRIKALQVSGLGPASIAKTIGCSRIQVYRVLQEPYLTNASSSKRSVNFSNDRRKAAGLIAL